MFERVKLLRNKIEADVNQHSTNPISKENKKYISDSIFDKVKTLDIETDQNIKSLKADEIIKDIDNLSENELISLMKQPNEILRSFVARSFVGRSPKELFTKLENLLNNENENVRDSAVIALCYINSSNVLYLLDLAANDSSASIKMRALSGIADIATEHSDEKAKEILKQYLNDKDPKIREYVQDEFCFLN